MIVLAGIVVSVLVSAILALGLPWLSVHRGDIDALDGDPAERFSGSMQILRENIIADYDEDEPPTKVSTPLTRRAELTELRLVTCAAAMRRRRMVTVLKVITLLCPDLSVFNVVPDWAVAIPVVALVAFLISAWAGVKRIYHRFDEKAAQVKAGYTDGESTSMMKAIEEEETSRELSVGLTTPEATGPLWDPIPVIAPTHASKPLVPRTVRAIGLSVPVASTVIIPTADRLKGPKPRRAAPADWDMEEENHWSRAVGQ